jgi:hypothetical protein
MPRPPHRKQAAATGHDAVLLTALTNFLAANKALAMPVTWVTDDRGNFRFSRPLDVDGVTEESLLLFGRAVPTLPGRAVTLGLSWVDATGAGGHFDRLDWRPMDDHNNRGHGPPALRHVPQAGSHHHRLADNGSLAMGLAQAIRENLPVAVPLDPDPDWPGFLAEAASRWRIHDLVTAPTPPWQYELPLPGASRRSGQRPKG